MDRPSDLPLRPARPLNGPRLLRLAGLLAVMSALLLFALRDVPLDSILAVIGRLTLAQVGLLLLVNALVILSMTLRWWLVARAERPRLPFLPFVASRLAVFAVSYFTPGPQVGGEPLQVMHLRRELGQPMARALATVIMDKLLELLGNFLFIAFGLAAFLRLNRLTGTALPAWVWGPAVLLLFLPVLHIFLLRRGLRPASWLLQRTFPRLQRSRLMRLLSVSEYLAGSFTRRRPAYFAAALGASMLAWAGMAAEYLLILGFLGLHLPLEEALFGLTASLLAFLLPLPGGLGALEASQVAALGALGYPAVMAVSVTLIMRARDLLNGGLGLLLAARILHR